MRWHIHCRDNSLDKVTPHYKDNAICTSLFTTLSFNYFSQQHWRWLVIDSNSREMCGMTLPYVSRTRSSIAQYIKQDNDGRRTAGESQPGIVNKTVKTVFYLQKWCRLF